MDDKLKVLQLRNPDHILVPASEYFSWRQNGYYSIEPEIRVGIGYKYYIMMVKE